MLDNTEWMFLQTALGLGWSCHNVTHKIWKSLEQKELVAWVCDPILGKKYGVWSLTAKGKQILKIGLTLNELLNNTPRPDLPSGTWTLRD